VIGQRTVFDAGQRTGVFAGALGIETLFHIRGRRIVAALAEGEVLVDAPGQLRDDLTLLRRQGVEILRGQVPHLLAVEVQVAKETFAVGQLLPVLQESLLLVGRQFVERRQHVGSRHPADPLT